MKKVVLWFFSFGALALSSLNGQTVTSTSPTTTTSSSPILSTQTNQTLKIGIVNTKKCLEQSKLGKQEHANFEKMKKQMESVLQEKEKTLDDVESKLNDDDYMDSVSEDVAMDLKRKRRTVREEGMRLQSQYMQTLQQANMKIVQKLTEAITKASAQVAQDTTKGPFDLIFTDEACTFFAPRLDISDLVIAKMDALFDAEPKDNTPKTN